MKLILVFITKTRTKNKNTFFSIIVDMDKFIYIQQCQYYSKV